MKSAGGWNRLLLKFISLCQVDIQESSRENTTKFNFLGNNLGEQKVLESAFFRFSKSLKSKVFATTVPPAAYTGFITNLPFWAIQRLETLVRT